MGSPAFISITLPNYRVGYSGGAPGVPTPADLPTGHGSFIVTNGRLVTIITLVSIVLSLAITIMILPKPSWADSGMTNDSALSWKGQKMSQEELIQRGEELYAALQARYKDIVAAHELPHANGRGKDISDVISKYMPTGMSFEDAEKILRAAKVDLAATPPRPARLDDPDYDRYDILGGITLSQGLFGNVEVRVAIHPNVPGDPYAAVLKSEAWIVANSL